MASDGGGQECNEEWQEQLGVVEEVAHGLADKQVYRQAAQSRIKAQRTALTREAWSTAPPQTP